MLQGQNGFEELRRYIKQGGDFCKDLSSILQERYVIPQRKYDSCSSDHKFHIIFHWNLSWASWIHSTIDILISKTHFI
jgi:hypothetical protein